MVMSVHHGLEKQIHSTAFLYSDLYKTRPTPFLQRNLTKALDEHKRELQAQINDVVPTTSLPGPRSWRPPNDELVAFIASRHSTCELQIHPEITIKPPNYSYSNGPTLNSKVVFITGCLLSFTIYRKDTRNAWKVKFRGWSDATIKAYKDGTAIFSMPQHMKIPSRVFTALDMEHGGGALHRHVGPNDVMKISLQCEHPSNNLALFDFVGLGQHQHPANGQYLRSYVYNLLRCQTKDKGLSIKLADESDKMRTSQHTLHIDMEWVVPKMSIMEELNLATRLELGTKPSLPTTSQPPEPLRLTYKCDQAGSQKPLVLKGCLCPFCYMRDFGNMERLRLHLKLEHNRFHFTFDDSKPLELAAPKEVHAKLTFKEGAEKSIPNSEKEIRWIAPGRPFDLDAFLDGDESWIMGRKPKLPWAAITAAPLRRKKPEEVEDLPKPKRRRVKVPRIMEEGENLRLFAMHSRRPLTEGEWVSEDEGARVPSWVVSKIRRRSPTWPRAAVAFMDRWDLHMLGEPLKSDLVIGEAVVRFCRYNEQWIRENPDIAREFVKKLSELLEDDLISVEVFEYCKVRSEAEPNVANTVNGKQAERGEKRKRDIDVANNEETDSFCRPNLPKMAKMDDGMQADKEKENAPWRNPIWPAQDAASSPLLKTPILQTRSKQRDTKSSEPANNAAVNSKTLLRPPPDVCACFCGKVITAIDAPKAIACANLTCIREEFHLSCVGLENRVPEWQCDDCAPPSGAR